MASLAYFPFYPGDWLGDPRVASLTLEEQGAYFRLLCLMWNYQSGRCALPNDDAQLAMMLGVSRRKWTKLRRALIDRKNSVLVLTADGEWVTSPRLEAEYQKAVDKSRKAAMSGKQRSGRSANAQRTLSERSASAERTLSERSADGQPPIEPEPESDSYGGSPSLGGTEVTKEQQPHMSGRGGRTPEPPVRDVYDAPPERVYPEAFERFWRVFLDAGCPRMDDKGATYRLWQDWTAGKVPVDGKRHRVSPSDLLTAARHYAASVDPAYLKMPKTFLSERDAPWIEWVRPRVPPIRAGPNGRAPDAAAIWHLADEIEAEEAVAHDQGRRDAAVSRDPGDDPQHASLRP